MANFLASLFRASTSSSIFNIDRCVDKIDCECTSEMIRVKLFLEEIGMKKKMKRHHGNTFMISFRQHVRYAAHFVLSTEVIDSLTMISLLISFWLMSYEFCVE